TAVKPATPLAYVEKLWSSVARTLHAATQSVRLARNPPRSCGNAMVIRTIATAPAIVPMIRAQPLRKAAPTAGWPTIAAGAVTPAQAGRSSSRRNARNSASTTAAQSRKPYDTAGKPNFSVPDSVAGSGAALDWGVTVASRAAVELRYANAL